VRGLGALLALATAVAAGTVEEYAKTVVAAHAAGDTAKLASLANREEPDPWIIVDELLYAGEAEAALAFAEAGKGVDTEALPRYVRAQEGRGPTKEVYDTVSACSDALIARRPDDVLAALAKLQDYGPGINGVRLRYYKGLACNWLARYEDGAQTFREAGTRAKALGWISLAAYAAHEAGFCCNARSEFEAARDLWRERLELQTKRGSVRGVMEAQADLGVVLVRFGEFDESRRLLEAAHDRAQELKDDSVCFRTLVNLGTVHTNLSAFDQALACYEEAARIVRKLGDDAGLARVLANSSILHRRLGDYPRALADALEARRLFVEQNDVAAAAKACDLLGDVYSVRGEYAEALRYYARELDAADLLEPVDVANALTSVANVHLSLEQPDKALRYYELALRRQEAMGDQLGAIITRGNMGTALFHLREYDKALRVLQRTLDVARERSMQGAVADMLSNLGGVYYQKGEYDQALAHHTEALALRRAIGQRFGIAVAEGNLGLCHKALGDYDEAVRCFESAVASAHELGDLDTEVRNVLDLAGAYLAQDHPDQALAQTRRAFAGLALLSAGLGADQADAARERWYVSIENGVRAALLLDDADGLSTVLEHCRAGVLREALGGRGAVGDPEVPPELLDRERAARHVVFGCRARLQRAQAAGALDEIRAAQEALQEAQDDFGVIVSRIQREAKKKADVRSLEPATLPEIQAALAPEDAFVSYVFLEEGAAALVVTAKKARIADLGPSEGLESELAPFRAGSEEGEFPGDTLARARAELVRPLELPDGVRRVIVAPDGWLAYAPFALLFPHSDLAYVPSGSVLTALRARGAARGTRVLALGDPDYGTAPDRVALQVMRSGEQLVPLPGSGAEARAAGDVVLLGKQATEAGLVAALAKRKRWRAVHLACHGLMHPERPLLSSLALTPGGGRDGFLSTVEIFRLKIPADLVVLSACETARGKIYRAEGVMGFTRAFLIAGSSRVLVSLWKVDDAATRALMEQFYGRWNPKEGAGEAAATALREAQQAVAAMRDEWREPRFWAAWQLWGLPD